MNGLIRKANKKKKKYQINKNKYENKNDSDCELSDDNVEDLEEELLGKIMDDKYIIIKYINRGTFSKVWLVYNYISNKFFIAKMYTDDTDEFKNELSILKQYSQYDPESKFNLTYIDNFIFIDKAICYKVLILPYYGLPLNALIDDDEKMTLQSAKKITYSLLQSVKKLHELNILHADLKMDNILTTYHDASQKQFIDWVLSLKLNDIYDEFLKSSLDLADYENMNKSKKKNYKRKIRTKSQNNIKIIFRKAHESKYTSNKKENEDELVTIRMKMLNNLDNNDVQFVLSDYSNSILEKDVDAEDFVQTRPYRSPENILGYGYNRLSEVWAIGCIFWDLLTYDNIFDISSLKGNSLDRDREQLAHMEKYLGKINKDMSLDCPRSFELYEDNGKIIRNKKIVRQTIEDKLRELRPDLTESEINDVCGLMKQIWNYNYLKRISVEDLLKHPFFITE